MLTTACKAAWQVSAGAVPLPLASAQWAIVNAGAPLHCAIRSDPGGREKPEEYSTKPGKVRMATSRGAVLSAINSKNHRFHLNCIKCWLPAPGKHTMMVGADNENKEDRGLRQGSQSQPCARSPSPKAKCMLILQSQHVHSSLFQPICTLFEACRAEEARQYWAQSHAACSLQRECQLGQRRLCVVG